mgnify:CR=1 FL=1
MNFAFFLFKLHIICILDRRNDGSRTLYRTTTGTNRYAQKTKFDLRVNLIEIFQMMSLKRKFFEENPDGKDCKQRQRMTTYHLNNIFRMRLVHFFDKKNNETQL